MESHGKEEGKSNGNWGVHREYPLEIEMITGFIGGLESSCCLLLQMTGKQKVNGDCMDAFLQRECNLRLGGHVVLINILLNTYDLAFLMGTLSFITTCIPRCCSLG